MDTDAVGGLADCSHQNLQVIRHAEVSKRVGVGVSTLFDMIAKGQFPKPFVIIPGGRAVGWLDSDVDAWIFQRRSTDAGTPR